MRTIAVFLAVCSVGAWGSEPAAAGGGSYVIDGGSAEAQAQVRAALDASRFRWDTVPSTIRIEIRDCGCAGAKPGVITLDETTLTSSPWGKKYAWALVQHEYAHQVDFLALSTAARNRLTSVLGGAAWCYEVAGVAHDDHGCERLATALTWAFWPSRANVERPDWDGSEDLTRRGVRRLVNRLVASSAAAIAPAPVAVSDTALLDSTS